MDRARKAGIFWKLQDIFGFSWTPRMNLGKIAARRDVESGHFNGLKTRANQRSNSLLSAWQPLANRTNL
jgi:hypothetical protein